MKPEAAGLTVKQMMEEHITTMGKIHQTQIALLQVSLKRQADTVVNAVETVARSIDSQTDDFLAAMGQFTNEI